MNIHASSSARGPLRWALSGALFPLFFELGEVVALQLATAPLPLPDAPVAEVVAYYGGTAFYARLFDIPGQRHPGARQYFQCGSVIVAVIDPTQGGMAPTPGPKSLYFAVRDVHAVHQRAAELNAWHPTPSTVRPPPRFSSGPGASAPSTSWTRGATTCASWRKAHSTPDRVVLLSKVSGPAPLAFRPNFYLL
jgi:hypothetical protein